MKKHNLEAFYKYYSNATKEQAIEDMFLDNCNLQEEIERLERQIKIKDNWCRLIYDIGYDYDGFRNDIEGLRGVVDELVRYSVGALKSDDKTVVYVGEENGVEIKENILMERIESDKE